MLLWVLFLAGFVRKCGGVGDDEEGEGRARSELGRI